MGGRAREMRRLCALLSTSLELPVPVDPARLFEELAATLSAHRQRELRLRFVAFPPGTVSGIWADRGDHDLIAVEEAAAPQHQLVILGHEIWHMHAGHGGGHAGTSAARSVTEETDLQEVIVRAARTDFADKEERAAELFGIMLGAELRPWLEGHPGGTAPEGLAGRLQASLGRHGVQGRR
ncbi:toxin-antitoxin system, toxin component [Streptomyces sp. CA-251247]|uniref:toxin-antitoxin system, toxin component n=1 Tax=Streptomyces sp. CA-251247 TaxID=3240062 RepID=UPI003D8C209E